MNELDGNLAPVIISRLWASIASISGGVTHDLLCHCAEKESTQRLKGPLVILHSSSLS